LSRRDYWTVDQLIQHLTNGLPSFNFSWSHLTRVWNWKGLSAFDIPPLHGLARVHCVNIFRNRGIWVKWKQYMTSESWSRPVLLIPPHEMPALVAWRPDQVVQEWSPNDQTSKLAWVNKLESILSDTSQYGADMNFLRQVIRREQPFFYRWPFNRASDSRS